MPLDYRRDDGKRRLTVTSTGSVTLAETLAIIDRQAADGAWSYSVLYDLRASEDVPTAGDVHQLVLRVGTLTTRHGPRGRVAFLVSDPALSKMCHRYAKLGDLTALEVHSFADVEAAGRWLDEG